MIIAALGGTLSTLHTSLSPSSRITGVGKPVACTSVDVAAAAKTPKNRAVAKDIANLRKVFIIIYLHGMYLFQISIIQLMNRLFKYLIKFWLNFDKKLKNCWKIA